MAQIEVNGRAVAAPQSKEEFKSLVESWGAEHGELRSETLLFALVSRGEEERTVAAMAVEGKFLTLHLLYELVGRPEFTDCGYVEGVLSDAQVKSLAALFAPYHQEAGQHPNVAFALQAASQGSAVHYLILGKTCADEEQRDAYLQLRTTTLFDLFNEGALCGADAAARQALLDSFSVLPNRYLTSAGTFMLPNDEEPRFLRNVANYLELTGQQTLVAGGIDKFPSLLSQRGDRLRKDGNRVIPSAMIRDGVYVGKRNIFMFHVAVNIAAYIGDDNLIDSHASIGSAAQVGNRNKIGSFVSLEGVLSPANAQGVIIGDDNFLGSFVRVGTGIVIGSKNVLGAGVNISLGTKLRDCREASSTRGDYVACRDLVGSLNGLVIAPNNATREFQGVNIMPGEYILFENSEEFMSRFEGDARIKGR